MPWLQYSLTIFPEFIFVLAISVLLNLVFSGIFLHFFPKKIGWLNITISSYAGFSLFIILNYLLWYIFDWQLAIALISVAILLTSIYGWYRAKPRLDIKFSKFFITLSIATVLLSFFLFKFTYHNGLHDEYFHYAAIQLFEHTNQYPFLHPYDFEHTLNEVYHVGTYFLVILINLIPGFDLEQALDAAKILIFLPFPVFLGYALKETFAKVPSWLLAGTVILTLLAGPSWWLRDSYTLWLTQGKELPQIYMPLLYDLAGITWTGVLFWIVFTLSLIIFLTKRPISKLPFIPLVVILFSTIFINKAYMLTSFISLVTVFFSILFIKFFSKKSWVHIIIWASLVVLPLLLIAVSYFSFAEPFNRILRNYNNFGYHYASYLYQDGIQVDYNYLAISDSRFFTTLGLAPLIIFITTIYLMYNFNQISKKLQILAILFITFSLLIPIGLYFVNDGGLGLALNKLLRPAFLFVALTPITFYQFHKKRVSYILLLIIMLGAISPIRFFIVNVGEGLQRFWVTESPDTQTASGLLLNQDYQYILTPDWGTAYSFSNLQPIQSFACVRCDSPKAQALVSPRDEGLEKYYYNLPTIFENDSYIVKQLK